MNRVAAQSAVNDLRIMGVASTEVSKGGTGHRASNGNEATNRHGSHMEMTIQAQKCRVFARIRVLPKKHSQVCLRCDRSCRRIT